MTFSIQNKGPKEASHSASPLALFISRYRKRSAQNETFREAHGLFLLLEIRGSKSCGNGPVVTFQGLKL